MLEGDNNDGVRVLKKFEVEPTRGMWYGGDRGPQERCFNTGFEHGLQEATGRMCHSCIIARAESTSW